MSKIKAAKTSNWLPVQAPPITVGPIVSAFSTIMVVPQGDCDVNAGVQQCCSARKCGGKVLSNKDAHNCKNSGGKSWHNAAGQCYNL